MKQLIILLIVIFFAIACSTQKHVVEANNPKEKEVVQDSIEYDMETFDARFESWYIRHNNPAKYRSLKYYEDWNRQYVSVWNNRAMTSRDKFFEPIAGYDPNKEYGFELNHKLFYYFQYVEKVLKIKIMPGGPKVVL